MTRQINEAGLALIKSFEKLALTAYRDQGGLWTIGWGHTDGVKEGDICTAETAEEYLDQDLLCAEESVEQRVTVPLGNNEFAGLVPFVFNVGDTQFKESTLLRKLNEGGYGLVPTYLRSWIFVKGKISQGLVKRRAAEAALWSTQ